MKLNIGLSAFAVLVSVSFIFYSIDVRAQGSESDRFGQIGAFIGKVLPNGVDGAEEIFTLSGVRYSSPFGKGNGFAEFGAIFGNSEGVNWQSAFASVSMQVPVETLIGHAGVGADFTRYETETTPTKNYGGVHFIGGILNRIGGSTYARFDMKLNSKPGTSLYFALGLVIELDGGGDTP